MNYDTDGNYYVILIGDARRGRQLSLQEINDYYYKFRVVYTRTNKITVDLSPSLPRDAQGKVLDGPDAVAKLFNNYNGEEDHCFADAHISYGYSVYDSEKWDYKTELESGSANVYSASFYVPDPFSQSGSMLVKQYPTTAAYTLPSAACVNLQWICFGLPKEDLLLLNGRAYPGDAVIWLTKDDLKDVKWLPADLELVADVEKAFI